jgi:hypothetical protein
MILLQARPMLMQAMMLYVTAIQPTSMPKKIFYSIIIILILVIIGGSAYFFLYLNKPAPAGGVGAVGSNPFNPFGSAGNGTAGQGGNGSNGSNTSASGATNQETFQWPKVREIWATPVGGFVASSTTATSTFVRFVDRGTGYVYDMNAASATPMIASNTTVPLVYESYWNRNGMSAIFRYIKEGTDDITNFYVELRSNPATVVAGSNTGTSTTAVSAPVLTTTPYALRGKYFPGTIIDAAVSPKGNQIFTIELVNGASEGFISNLDGSGSTEIFSTPLTQVDAFWPTATTLMMATKASANSAGYLYSINAKTGAMSEVLGGVNGLSVVPNPTGQLVLYSDLSTSGSLVTSLYNIKTASSQDLPFVTLAEKCVWSRANPNDLFCAVPSTVPSGTYPDDWYKGTASTIDRIWEIDTDTGTVHLVSDLTQDAKVSIDAEWLALDPTERFLYFVNKKDLSLWSLDLNQ